ncbi:MAG: 6-hydroxymethylpterin diphosphokinase MptE-like protein [Leptospirales bacterium]
MPSSEIIITGEKAEYTLKSIDGQYSISFRDEKKNKQRPVNSARDPKRESDRLLGSFCLKEGLIALVQGGAALNSLETLVHQKKQHGGLIIAVESDNMLAKTLQNEFPSIFSQVLFIYPECGFDINDVLEEIEIENVAGYRSFSLQGSVQMDNQYYSSVFADFNKSFSSRVSDLLTRIEFEPRWITNALVNSGRIKNAIFANQVFGSGKGYHAALISSGPSLRSSIDVLKQNRDNFFVAVVDSAYRVLLRHGITPDLVFSLDSQGYTLRHICGLPQGNKGQPPFLYADLVSNPQLLYRWKGPLILGTTAQYSGERRVVTPGCDYIEDNLDLRFGDVQSGGSVATSLFDLLRTMEFDSITLFGQDLAFTHREIHTMGTHHTDLWLSKNTDRLNSLENISHKVMRKRKIHWEKSNAGEEIPVDYVLSLYRHWFEKAIEKLSIPVYMASDLGAKVEGTIMGIPDIKSKSVEVIKKLVRISEKSHETKNKTENRALDLFNSILKSQYNAGLIKTFSFLHKIGRKLIIKQNRESVSAAEQTMDYEKEIEQEREVFWGRLQKKIKIYKAKAQF